MDLPLKKLTTKTVPFSKIPKSLNIGLAQNEAELEKVLNHAKNINGVKRVINHVRLKEKSLEY